MFILSYAISCNLHSSLFTPNSSLKVFTIMEFLPKDPAILVSSINMLLRDEEFDTLESLCYSFSREPEEIKEYLIKNDYVYSEEQKQFRPVGYDE